ncbi:MAG: guanylate kinase [Sedimentisphaerales bacterium]|nr:guanylate kinase [Sedimentisphaerales bacterium]
MTSQADQNKTCGKLIVVSGPSGVGKSTICKEVVKRMEDVHLSVSATTRPPGPGEQNGRDYWFISKEEFRERIEQGLLLEYAEVFGNLYGTPKEKVDEALQAGRIVILEIDTQGGKQVKAACPDAVMVFILPPDDRELAQRIGRRARDSADAIETRLGGAGNEIAAAKQYYDHMVINEDLEHAIGEVMQIIRQAREGAAAGHDENSGER